jgi:septum site-determining protein MinC
MQSKSNKHSTFEIKSTDISVLSIKLKNNDINLFENELINEFGPQGADENFFSGDNIIIDISDKDIFLNEDQLLSIISIIKKCKLNPIALRSESEKLLSVAKNSGLEQASPDTHKHRRPESEAPSVQVIQEVVREVATHALIVDKPLRSGQKIYARGCDLVVLAMVNQGAEIISDGNIHVYAPLRGKAMAGARGNTEARIFTMCLEAELISIAGVYRTSENPLPDDVKGKPSQIRLSNDGQEKMIIESLKL